MKHDPLAHTEYIISFSTQVTMLVFFFFSFPFTMKHDPLAHTDYIISFSTQVTMLVLKACESY